MYKVIFWDFDGVILDSNEIRTNGFREVLKKYPVEKVEKLILYHKINGGLSRYVKFRYFFEKILQRQISENEISILSKSFSDIVLRKLKDPKLLIESTLNFIQKNYNNYKMFIVSGSDGVELRKICKFLNIDKYFLKIEGSPTDKTTLVNDILVEYDFNSDECILVGDSINDFNAATKNRIHFMGIGEVNLVNKSNSLLF